MSATLICEHCLPRVPRTLSGHRSPLHVSHWVDSRLTEQMEAQPSPCGRGHQSPHRTLRQRLSGAPAGGIRVGPFSSVYICASATPPGAVHGKCGAQRRESLPTRPGLVEPLGSKPMRAIFPACTSPALSRRAMATWSRQWWCCPHLTRRAGTLGPRLDVSNNCREHS